MSSLYNAIKSFETTHLVQKVTLNTFDVCLFSGVYFSLFPFPPTRYPHEAYLSHAYTSLRGSYTHDERHEGIQTMLKHQMEEYEGNRMLLTELCEFLIKENQGLLFQVFYFFLSLFLFLYDDDDDDMYDD